MKKSKIIGLSLGIVAATAITVTTPLLITSCSKEEQTNNDGGSSNGNTGGSTGNNNGSNGNGGGSIILPNEPTKEIGLSGWNLTQIGNRMCNTAQGVTEARFLQALKDIDEYDQIKTELVENLVIIGWTKKVIGKVEIKKGAMNGDTKMRIHPAKGFSFKQGKDKDEQKPSQFALNPLRKASIVNGVIEIQVKFGDYIKIPINVVQKSIMATKANNLTSTIKPSQVFNNQEEIKREISKWCRIKPHMIKSVAPIKSGRNYDGLEITAKNEYKFISALLEAYAKDPKPTTTISKSGANITITNLTFLPE